MVGVRLWSGVEYLTHSEEIAACAKELAKIPTGAGPKGRPYKARPIPTTAAKRRLQGRKTRLFSAERCDHLRIGQP